jgi:hypothetical protein
MKRFFVLITTGIVLAAPGCAAPSEGAEDVASGDKALSTVTVGEAAVALEITRVPTDRTVMAETFTVAGAKLAKVTRAMKRRSPSESVPPAPARCEVPLIQGYYFDFRYLDAKGAETSKGSVSCSGIGQLFVGDKNVPIRVGDALNEVANAPQVPGDVLWGITKVTVMRPGSSGGTKEVTGQEGIAALVDAIDKDQEIDPRDPVARCLPSFVVTYKRGSADAASASFDCGGGATTSKARFAFSVAGWTTAGTISIATRPFTELFSAARRQ